MIKRIKLVFILVAIASLYCSAVFGEIIPSDRRINWDPGIPGGIPIRTTIFADVKSDYGAVGDGITDDTAAIQTAINDCPAGQVVYIPEGTYKISDTLNVGGKDIVIRGAGPDKTKIIQHAGKDVIRLQGIGYMGSALANIISGHTKDSTTITVDNAAGFQVGQSVIIDQFNDTSFATNLAADGTNRTYCGTARCSTNPNIYCGGHNPLASCDNGAGFCEGGKRVMGEVALVTNISGNDITLNRGLYHTYDSALIPQLMPVSNSYGGGVEDLYVEIAPGVGVEGAGISLFSKIHAWVKNVETYNIYTQHIQVRMCYGCVIRDNYSHHAQSYDGSMGYGINIPAYSCDNLIENNIVYHCHGLISMEIGTCSGNVIAYNYLELGLNRSYPNANWMMPHLGTHGSHPFMNLYEGNSLGQVHLDNLHGSTSHLTFLRNLITGDNKYPLTNANLSAVLINGSSYYINFVGNVLGEPGYTGQVEQIPYLTYFDNPVLWHIGYNCCSATGNPTDPKVQETLLKHGNWEGATNAAQWDPDISDHNIPDSYYLFSKPAFFGSMPWPSIGPDVTPVNGDIPAKVRFQELKNTQAPVPPTPVKAKANSASSIVLSWPDVPDTETGYAVERSPDGSNFAPLCTLPADSTSYLDTGLNQQTRYYYRIYAYNDNGNSGYSNVVNDLTFPASVSGNLVAWYKFDDTAEDASSNAYHGTPHNTTTVAGKYNQAYDFDGSASDVFVNWNAPLTGSYMSFTVAAWVKTDDTTGDHMIIGDAAEYNHFNFGLYSGTLTIYWRYLSNSQLTSFINLNSFQAIDGDFKHVAATYDSSTKIVSLYIDGVQVAQDTTTQPRGIGDMLSFYIGRGHITRSTTPQYFNGTIDDVKIYRIALTQPEIQSIMQGEISDLPCDINNDSQVNALDIQACVNHVLMVQDWGSAADVNNSGGVDAVDIQAIVNEVLGI